MSSEKAKIGGGPWQKASSNCCSEPDLPNEPCPLHCGFKCFQSHRDPAPSSDRHGFRLPMALGRGDSGNTRLSPFSGLKKFPLPGKHVMLITKGVRIVLSDLIYKCSGPGDMNVSI